MATKSAFDYALPYDIMVGYWVGTANIYSPRGGYVMSTKSYVSVFWEEHGKRLCFRQSAQDDYFPNKATTALQVMTVNLEVKGPYAYSYPKTNPVTVTGRQTRPDVYQFHVQREVLCYGEKVPEVHHVYNSHHLPSPDDWHIIGPIVGPVKVDKIDKEKRLGEVGVSVVQNYRRISYIAPPASKTKLA
jgi:hypothetical protein